MNVTTIIVLKTLGIKQTESQWLGVLWQIKKNTLTGTIGIVGIENCFNQKTINTKSNFYTYNVNMKILPISFYAVRLSASVWFRKKLCGKIKVVFNVNVMRRFTIASNGWLCVCWGFKCRVLSACWLVQKQDKTTIYHNCPNSAKPPLLAVVSIYSHIHTKYILSILN